MRFYEYESRKIVEEAGIPVTKYGFVTSAEEAKAAAAEIGGPVVIKSQVLSGGRMKAGGVQFADTPEEAEGHARNVLQLEIGGPRPQARRVHPQAGARCRRASWSAPRRRSSRSSTQGSSGTGRASSR